MSHLFISSFIYGQLSKLRARFWISGVRDGQQPVQPLFIYTVGILSRRAREKRIQYCALWGSFFCYWSFLLRVSNRRGSRVAGECRGSRVNVAGRGYISRVAGKCRGSRVNVAG